MNGLNRGEGNMSAGVIKKAIITAGCSLALISYVSLPTHAQGMRLQPPAPAQGTQPNGSVGAGTGSTAPNPSSAGQGQNQTGKSHTSPNVKEKPGNSSGM